MQENGAGEAHDGPGASTPGPSIIEIRRTGYESGPKWQMRVLAHDGLLIDSTFASTRWGAWRMAKSSWREFTKAYRRRTDQFDGKAARASCD